MEHFPYVIAICAIVGMAAWLFWRQRRVTEQAKMEREAIEIEEQRMFHFLHGLGSRCRWTARLPTCTATS